jgi:hypothetical protein
MLTSASLLLHTPALWADMAISNAYANVACNVSIRVLYTAMMKNVTYGIRDAMNEKQALNVVSYS